MPVDEREHFETVARLGNHLHALERLHEGTDSRAHEGMIVGNEHAESSFAPNR